MMRIEEVSTPTTLKTLKTSSGEYVLKGDKDFRKPADGDIYSSKYLKLYKKEKHDGLDTFQLIGQKKEKYLMNGKKPTFISITKESFCPKTGKLTEYSFISQNVGGGKNIECFGDVLNIQGSVSTNTGNNKINFSLNTFNQKLTPIAKRVLKILSR